MSDISLHGPLETVPTGGQVSPGLGRTSVRSGFCKSLMTHFLFLLPHPNLMPELGVPGDARIWVAPSMNCCGASVGRPLTYQSCIASKFAARITPRGSKLLLVGLCKQWEVTLVGINLSWDPEWRGTQLDSLDYQKQILGKRVQDTLLMRAR